MPLEYVRVKIKDDPNGAHVSVLKQEAENNPDAYTVLKQPAVNGNGDPLPAEIPESASTPKPARKRAAKKSAPKPLSSTTNQGQSAITTPKEQ